MGLRDRITRLEKQSDKAVARPEDGARLDSSRVAVGSTYIPHEPWPKQKRFLALDSLEALYGGAAGGGKSEALLAAALEYIHVPGYAAILFRRTFTDLALPDALIARSQEWLAGTDARWNEQKKRWTFPSSATLSFGYLEHENDKYRYQGAAFQFVGFDELTQFSLSQYTYMFSRCRRPKGLDDATAPLARVPLRVRAASNPGGTGHEWVKQRFLIEGETHGRPFIPARLEDNPALEYESYAASLQRLDPVTRAQLLEGDWDVRQEGTLFRRDDFVIVDAGPVDLTAVRFWDFGASDPKPGQDPDWTAGAKVGIDDHGQVYVFDVRRIRSTPAEVERFVRQTAEDDGQGVYVFLEQEPGASGRSFVDYYRRRVLQGFPVTELVASSRGSKLTLAAPLASQVEGRNVRLVRGSWIGDFLDEAAGFPEAIHDDMVDAVASAFYVLTNSHFKARTAQRRASVGAAAYVNRRFRECKCGQMVWFPLDVATVHCHSCGTRHDRSDPQRPPEPSLPAPAEMRVQGECPKCKFDILVKDNADEVTCRRCGFVVEAVGGGRAHG
jgi:predicted phage terminase large subunit-like protein